MFCPLNGAQNYENNHTKMHVGQNFTTFFYNVSNSGNNGSFGKCFMDKSGFDVSDRLLAGSCLHMVCHSNIMHSFLFLSGRGTPLTINQ
jgi:hypothetical protein